MFQFWPWAAWLVDSWLIKLISNYFDNKYFKQNCQIFAGPSFLNEKFYCVSLSFMSLVIEQKNLKTTLLVLRGTLMTIFKTINRFYFEVYQ